MPEIQGYTTINDRWDVLTDKDLVKHDLLLELYTHKGDCDWNPSFGTTITDQIFQYKSNSVRETIKEEITAVVDRCPFLALQEITTDELEKGWTFNITVSYMNELPEEWSIPITEESAKDFISTGSLPLEEL